MRKKNLFLAALLLVATTVWGENWQSIISSGLYYYGEGTGPTQAEAERTALDALVKMVAREKSGEFGLLRDEDNFDLLVFKCLQTYMEPSSMKSWQRETPKGTARLYLERTRMAALIAERTRRMTDMLAAASRHVEACNLDLALKSYYWAYSLLRTLPEGDKLKDRWGRVLAKRLPEVIKDIIEGVQVKCVRSDMDGADFRFSYRGKPVSVDFLYYDGWKDDNEAHASDGCGEIDTHEGYDGRDGYRIKVKFEYRSWARGDREMKAVLAAVPRIEFAQPKELAAVHSKPSAHAEDKTEVRVVDKKMKDVSAYVERINEVVDAIRKNQIDKAVGMFNRKGVRNERLNKFSDFVYRNNGRVHGTPSLTLYPGADGQVTVRGLKMAFTVVERGRKTTLVDEVIFTFDKDMNICNLTFGLGSVAENDILLKNAQWTDTTRQLVMDFLENYKTAYCLKEFEYISSIFDENATIVVGSVAKRTSRPGVPESRLRRFSDEEVTYRRYNKQQYLESLKRTFDRNQFVNIKFIQNDVMKLEKELPRQVFQIQIGQEYNSSTYADQGYLFLLVDMTDKSQPLIRIRGWQPKPDPEFGLFTAGYFLK